jgi:hypothetical protein
VSKEPTAPVRPVVLEQRIDANDPKSEGDSLGQSVALLLLAGVVLVFAAVGIRSLSDPDLGWHLRTGQLVLHHGFVHSDPWSFASSQPWVLHEWGGEVLMYLAYAAGGYHGVIALRMTLMLILAVLIAISCAKHAGPLASAAATAMAGLALWTRATERPQLISFCILAAVLPALYASVRRRRVPWWLIPVTAAWANVHALWIIGPLLLAVLIVSMAMDDRDLSPRTWWPWIGCLVAVVCAAMVNPAGPKILGIFHVGGAGFIAEFGTPRLTDPTNITAALLALIVIFSWARSRSRVPWVEVGYVVALVGLGFMYYRNVPIAAIGLAPLAASAMSRARGPARITTVPARDRIGLGVVTLVFLVFAGERIAATPGLFGGHPLEPGRRLDALPGHARVLNEYNDGGWLLWTAQGSSVAIDGRAEVYGAPYVHAYFSAHDLKPGWQRFVSHGDFSAAYLYRTTPLVQGLKWQGWRTVWRYDHHVLMLPPTPAPS